MKARPLYRSITFWSGILMMAFICWASSFSRGKYSYLNAPPFAMNSTNGIVFLMNFGASDWTAGHVDRGSLDGGRFPPLVFLRGEGKPRQRSSATAPTLREVMKHGMRARATNCWLLAIPHWLILFAVALSWSGALLWRARRIRRAD